MDQRKQGFIDCRRLDHGGIGPEIQVQVALWPVGFCLVAGVE
jgi:hypothetical protein